MRNSRSPPPNIRFSTTFDVPVISGREGVGQARPAHFRDPAERVGLPPGELLFVDNSLKNVEAARAFGIETLHYRPGRRSRARIRRARAYRELSAVGAEARHFDHQPLGRKALRLRGAVDRRADALVLDLDAAPASLAAQQHAAMGVVEMRAGREHVAALDAVQKAVLDQEIERAIDRRRGDRLVLALGQRLDDRVGAERRGMFGQDRHHAGAVGVSASPRRAQACRTCSAQSGERRVRDARTCSASNISRARGLARADVIT